MFCEYGNVWLVIEKGHKILNVNVFQHNITLWKN